MRIDRKKQLQKNKTLLDNKKKRLKHTKSLQLFTSKFVRIMAFQVKIKKQQRHGASANKMSP